eukprot:XP_010645575.2 PREDICTED: uncharacterized protein LOC104877887 [Vitis vinifera]
MTVDLVLLDLQDFDVILGMDWLASYHASIDCFGKRVMFSFPNKLDFSFEGKHVDKPLRMILALRASSLLKKGCQGFLACVVNEEKDLKLENIPIVRDYPDVFLEDLPGLPPEREVEFTIDLAPGSAPISKAPYKMAPIELKELKIQLQELALNKVTVRNKYSLPRIDDLFDQRQGKVNVVVDALSRKSVGSLATIRGCQRQLLEDLRSLQVHIRVLDSRALVVNFRVQPVLVERIKTLQKNDMQLVQLMEEVKRGSKPDFVLADDGILRFGTRICVPNDRDLRKELLEEAHCSKFAIHPGETKMNRNLKQNYRWLGMKRDIARFVAQCLVCQQTDDQSERVIQVLEDLLRACALDLKGLAYIHCSTILPPISKTSISLPSGGLSIIK